MFVVKTLVEDIAPVFLVPMPRRGNGRELFAQFDVAFGRELHGKVRVGIVGSGVITAQPKADENFALDAEGDVVIAKRLVFGHPIERQGVFSDFFDVHDFKLLFSACKDTDYLRNIFQ